MPQQVAVLRSLHDRDGLRNALGLDPGAAQDVAFVVVGERHEGVDLRQRFLDEDRLVGGVRVDDGDPVELLGEFLGALGVFLEDPDREAARVQGAAEPDRHRGPAHDRDAPARVLGAVPERLEGGVEVLAIAEQDHDIPGFDGAPGTREGNERVAGDRDEPRPRGEFQLAERLARGGIG